MGRRSKQKMKMLKMKRSCSSRGSSSSAARRGLDLQERRLLLLRMTQSRALGQLLQQQLALVQEAQLILLVLVQQQRDLLW
jgi:hypothetical protein